MDVYTHIASLNGWKEHFLPNAEGIPPNMPEIDRGGNRPGGRTLLEAALLTPPGAWFERWEMNRKIRKLSREQTSSPESFFGADVCKGHMHRHGQYTEETLRERLESLAPERSL